MHMCMSFPLKAPHLFFVCCYFKTLSLALLVLVKIHYYFNKFHISFFKKKKKCNIDASFSQLSNRVGIEVCIRDDTKKDKICVEFHNFLIFKISALEWVHQLHLKLIDFKLDAKKVVNSFSSARHDVTKFGMIIHNCKTIFEQFQYFVS